MFFLVVDLILLVTQLFLFHDDFLLQRLLIDLELLNRILQVLTDMFEIPLVLKNSSHFILHFLDEIVLRIFLIYRTLHIGLQSFILSHQLVYLAGLIFRTHVCFCELRLKIVHPELRLLQQLRKIFFRIFLRYLMNSAQLVFLFYHKVLILVF